MKKLFSLNRLETHFNAYLSLITVFLVLIGFGYTYLPKLISSSESIPSIIHIHASVFVIWLFIFCAQIYFVRTQQLSLHKSFGKIGALWLLIMLVVGLFVTLDAGRTGHLGIPGVMFPNWHSFLFLNFAALFVFIFLGTLALSMTHKPQWHKRLMLMATLAGLGPPGFSRLPIISGHEAAIAGFVTILIFSAPILDFKFNKKLHPSYFISMPLVILILPPVVTIIGKTEFWIKCAEFLIQL